VDVAPCYDRCAGALQWGCRRSIRREIPWSTLNAALAVWRGGVPERSFRARMTLGAEGADGYFVTGFRISGVGYACDKGALFLVIRGLHGRRVVMVWPIGDELSWRTGRSADGARAVAHRTA
jgi:hypothetical protein